MLRLKLKSLFLLARVLTFGMRWRVSVHCLFEVSLITGHPASRTFSYGTYALYREKALHELCQVLVEHAQGVAKIRFGTQAESVFILKTARKWRVNKAQEMSSCGMSEKKIESFSSFPWFQFASIKTEIRIVQVKNKKDSYFLCCGINLYGAGSTYNLLSHDGLAKKISQIIRRTIDVERQSCRSVNPAWDVWSLWTNVFCVKLRTGEV